MRAVLAYSCRVDLVVEGRAEGFIGDDSNKKDFSRNLEKVGSGGDILEDDVTDQKFLFLRWPLVSIQPKLFRLENGLPFFEKLLLSDFP